jgi:glutamate/tyrosine decarboxylase-like PLP-dependent enzyme
MKNFFSSCTESRLRLSVESGYFHRDEATGSYLLKAFSFNYEKKQANPTDQPQTARLPSKVVDWLRGHLRNLAGFLFSLLSK